MSDQAPDTGAHRRLVIQPNASLSPEWAAVFLGSMCMVSFGIAGIFAWQGFWMVLPFAGLEMAALAGGLYWSLRGNAYREVISVDEDRVVVEAGRKLPEQRWEYKRAWVQVRLRPGPNRNSPSRLSLGSHGRRCELGSCLSDEERRQVAARLRQWVDEPVSVDPVSVVPVEAQSPAVGRQQS